MKTPAQVVNEIESQLRAVHDDSELERALPTRPEFGRDWFHELTKEESDDQVRPTALDVRHAVLEGLVRRQTKKLPPFLLYDEAGSALFDEITRLAEYYLTSAEHELLDAHADEIALAVFPLRSRHSPLPHVVEFGAGSALKSRVLLRAILKEQPCVYMPVDISPSALEAAKARLLGESRRLVVKALNMTHEAALDEVRDCDERKLMMFIGSSIGNYEDTAAAALLTKMREALSLHDALLIGFDLVKEVDKMVLAYDDAQGVTAAFNKNVLHRINREIHADFDPSEFRHRVRWNPQTSSVEMHLESLSEQTVHVCGGEVHFREGETIHTESSAKYDFDRMDRLLFAAGLFRAETWTHKEGYSLCLARATRLHFD